MKITLLEITDTKVCSSCNATKSLADFKKNSKCVQGRAGQCKACTNQYLKEKRAQGLCKSNKALANISGKRWEEKNKEFTSKYRSEYQKKNRARYNALEAKRRARLLSATVLWASEEAIAELYKDAKTSGMEVDHIIPLQGVLVCGLHCEDNLQLLTPTENRRKGNRV